MVDSDKSSYEDDTRAQNKKTIEDTKFRKNKNNSLTKTKSGLSEKEIGGPKGPEPTRFGDWERSGRCIDF